MDLGINGKVALVGASSSGLGLATAQRLAREGCRVAICSRSAERLNQAMAEIRAATPSLQGQQAIAVQHPQQNSFSYPA